MARRRGQFGDLGYPVTKMLAHTLARAGDAADFRLSRNGDGTVRAAAHSLRACGGAMARRRGQLAAPCGCGHTGACTHVGTGGRRARFSTICEPPASLRSQDSFWLESTCCTGCRYGGAPFLLRAPSLLRWATPARLATSRRRVLAAEEARYGAIRHRSCHSWLRPARRMVPLCRFACLSSAVPCFSACATDLL